MAPTVRLLGPTSPRNVPPSLGVASANSGRLGFCLPGRRLPGAAFQSGDPCRERRVQCPLSRTLGPCVHQPRVTISGGVWNFYRRQETSARGYEAGIEIPQGWPNSSTGVDRLSPGWEKLSTSSSTSNSRRPTITVVRSCTGPARMVTSSPRRRCAGSSTSKQVSQIPRNYSEGSGALAGEPKTRPPRSSGNSSQGLHTDNTRLSARRRIDVGAGHHSAAAIDLPAGQRLTAASC